MGKMSEEIRKKRLAELLGLDVPVPPSPEKQEASALKSREAEATLLYIEQPKRFIERSCSWCEVKFAVNRTSIGYCSDACRVKALADKGIDWDPLSDDAKDRWRAGRAGPEPLVVPPAALELVRQDQPVTLPLAQ